MRGRYFLPVYSSSALWDLTLVQAPVKAAQYFQAKSSINKQFRHQLLSHMKNIRSMLNQNFG